MIPFIAALYFYIKHKVDKYNLIFNYYKKYESGGRIKQQVSTLMVINMVIYMATMVGFYGFKYPEPFFYWFGVVFSFVWLAIHYICLKYWNRPRVQKFFRKIRVAQVKLAQKPKQVVSKLLSKTESGVVD